MANATNTQVGRSVGHDRAVLVATSGQFCWPPTGSSNWPLTDSIVNRLANNARVINLGQIDMRRHRDDQARAQDGYCE